MLIEYVPGLAERVCEVEVLPLPQRNPTGATPPVEAALQVTLETKGTPEQETESALALAIDDDASKRDAAARVAANIRVCMRT